MTSKEALNWFIHETRDNYFYGNEKEQKQCELCFDIIAKDLELLKNIIECLDYDRKNKIVEIVMNKDDGGFYDLLDKVNINYDEPYDEYIG